MSNMIQNQIKKNNEMSKTSDTNAAAKQTVNQMLYSLLDSEKLRGRFEELLGKRTPQFLSAVVSLVNADPKLQKAFYEAPMTVIQAALKAATFDLPIDPNLGYAFIVPFDISHMNEEGQWYKRTEASFLLGWKGMHQLALRTGSYKVINVVDIREGELKSYNRLTEEFDLKFVADEDERDKLPIVGYLGYYRLVNGAEKTIYMTKKKIEKHEKENRKGDRMGKGWRDSWDDMARKTVYRKLIGKWGVMSIDYQSHSDGISLANQMQEEFELENGGLKENDTPIIDVEVGKETKEPIKGDITNE